MIPWGDLYAPVTSAMGFVRAPLEIVAGGLTSWRRTIHGSVKSERLDGGFRANVSALEPLTGGVRPRELVVSTGSPEWTAIFDCGIQGGGSGAGLGDKLNPRVEHGRIALAGAFGVDVLSTDSRLRWAESDAGARCRAIGIWGTKVSRT